MAGNNVPTNAPSGSVNGLRILPLCDSPMLQADVVLFAGVLHNHVVRGLQGPRPYVHPIVSVGLRIMNRHRVQDRTRVGTGEGVDELHILAVRMPDGVEPRVSVKAR